MSKTAYDVALEMLYAGHVPACFPFELNGKRMVVTVPWNPTTMEGAAKLGPRAPKAVRQQFICESLITIREVAEAEARRMMAAAEEE